MQNEIAFAVLGLNHLCLNLCIINPINAITNRCKIVQDWPILRLLYVYTISPYAVKNFASQKYLPFIRTFTLISINLKRCIRCNVQTYMKKIHFCVMKYSLSQQKGIYFINSNCIREEEGGGILSHATPRLLNSACVLILITLL